MTSCNHSGRSLRKLRGELRNELRRQLTRLERIGATAAGTATIGSEIVTLLRNLADEKGHTVLVITHDPAIAAGARIGVDYSFTPRGSAFTLQSAVTA